MHKPLQISVSEWKEIVQLPLIREAWGLTDESPEDFGSSVYGVKFNFTSGSPGYCGDLFILQGDALTGYPPITLIRGEDGTLGSAVDES
jgi:hypothetical protein